MAQTVGAGVIAAHNHRVSRSRSIRRKCGRADMGNALRISDGLRLDVKLMSAIRTATRRGRLVIDNATLTAWTGPEKHRSGPKLDATVCDFQVVPLWPNQRIHSKCVIALQNTGLDTGLGSIPLCPA